MRELSLRLAWLCVFLAELFCFPFSWLFNKAVDFLDNKLFAIHCEIEIAAAARRTRLERKIK